MAYQQYESYGQQPRPHYNQASSWSHQRAPPEQQYNQGGYTQASHAQGPVHDSYAGYDAEMIIDDYGMEEPAQRGYDSRYQQRRHGPGGYEQHRGQHAPPPQHREPPQRQEYYPSPVQSNGYGPPDGRGQPPSGRGLPPRFYPQQNYGHSRGPPQAHDVRGQYMQYDSVQQLPSGTGATPPRQKPRERLLPPTSPKAMPFDNPFPIFQTKKAPPQNSVDDAARSMANMDLHGKQSLDGQRPLMTSKNSGRSDQSRSQDSYGPPGPVQRAQTMPHNYENNEPYGRPAQGPQDLPDRSYTSVGDRPGPMRAPQRPSTATGMRPTRSEPYADNRRGYADDNFSQRPPPQNFGYSHPGPSYSHRGHPLPVQRDPMSKEAQLEAYMPDFDGHGSRTQPLQDPIGLPLDAAPEAGKTPVNGMQAQHAQQDLRGAISHPNLRGQPNGYPQNGYHGPVPPMPQNNAPMNSHRRSPPGALVTDPSQMPRAANGHVPSPISPRHFHRPGAPMVQSGGREATWSDAGVNGARGSPTGAPSHVTAPNPDALPAHPAPTRQPGTRPGAAAIRQEQVRRTSGSQREPAERIPAGPITVQELSRLREAVKATPQDQAQQLHFAKKLVEAADVLSSEGGRADPRTTQKNRENFIFEAHKVIKKLVSASYADAMFYLADAYGTGGLGLAVDPKEAFMLYQGAAKLGHGPSAYRTAVCCEMGQEQGGGTRKDPLKAVQWYRRAAALGDLPAMYKLGMILLKGHLGQAPNLGEAMIWLQRSANAADADNPHGLHELAALYETAPPGGKIIRDDNYALELYTKAAKFGYRNSQARLGKAYEYGQLGCAIDNRSSIHWYSKAAAQEDHEAELALSGWYLTGSPGILEQNDQEAYLWARKAAMAELPKAEFAMGYFSETGIGCPKSFEDAKRWYGRAAAHRYPKARERLEELMKGGSTGMKSRERISRSDHKKHEDCTIM